MRRFQSTMVSLALAAGWPLAAHAEELIDPSTVGIAAQHRIGTVGWGLTAGSEGFGELSVGLEALQLRGTIGPAHRHFTTLGAVDGIGGGGMSPRVTDRPSSASPPPASHKRVTSSIVSTVVGAVARKE